MVHDMQNLPEISQQMGYRPDGPPSEVPWQASPAYDEAMIEPLAQRLMPRLMPEIMFQLRNSDLQVGRSKSTGQALALAIVSIVMMIPLTAIILGAFSSYGLGITAALIGIVVIGVVMVAVNVAFDYMLFNIRR